MNIGEIIKDSIKYPFSDWKPFLIFGFIIILSSPDSIAEALGIGMAFMFKWGIFGLLLGVLINGYPIRIMRASMAGFDELPKFDSWFDIIINGIKVFIVDIAYFIPLFIILCIGGISFGFSVINEGTANSSAILDILIIAAFFYVVLAFPFYLMSLANMSFYEDLRYAFHFSEILDKISNIGWGKFIIWYIVNTVICILLIVLCALIQLFSTLMQLEIIGVLIISLIVIPFLIIYTFRSTALFYQSEDHGYLECENCGGYYQLQVGESPEDFEKCQCGGNLKHTSSILSNNIEKDHSNFSSFLKRKRNYILVGILALIIIAIPVIFSLSMPHHIITSEKTLLGSYDASQLETSNSSGTFIVIPPGTTNVKIEYNLSWAHVETGNNGFEVTGYNTNKTSYWGVPDNTNVIYNKGVYNFDENEDKNGIIKIDNSNVKSILISGNGVKGTVKVYAYKTKLTI